MRETIRNVALTTAALTTLIGVFGPWVRSGERRRSSFEVFDLVERLGFAPDGWFAWALRPWPLVPLALAGAVVAAWASRDRIAGWLGVGGGLYVALVALGVTRAPDAGLVATSWGVIVALVGGVATAAAGVGVLLVGRSTGRRPQPSVDVDRAQ